MKTVFFSLAFLCGVLAAIIMHGQMTHLRLLLPATSLPVWSSQILPDARLIRGTARLQSPAPFGSELDLRWRVSGVRLSGVVIDVDISGREMDMRGYVVIPFTMSEARFSATRARVALKSISGPLAFLQLEGQFIAQSMFISFDPLTRAIRMMETNGDIAEAQFETEFLGEGTFAMESDRQRVWWAEAHISGEAMELSLSLSGHLDDDVARMDIEIRDNGNMPARWKTRLGLFMQSHENSFTLSQNISIR